MSNALVIPDAPAYLAVASDQARARNLAAMGGIKAGGFPRISQGGGKFHIIEGDNKTLITDPNNPELPAMQLEVVVVGFNPAVSKTYYAGDWEPGDAEEPDCSSDNGVVPDSGVPAPQCTNCAACPQNVWGSKISKHNGKQIKACSDNKRLVIVRADDVAGSKAISLTITPGALKEWAEYVRALDGKGIEVSTVVTKVQFDPTVTFPKLVFKFGRYLTEAEVAQVRVREAGDDVRLIAAPKSSAPAPTSVPVSAPAAQPAAVPTAPAASAPPVQAAAPVAAEWKAGVPDNIVAAVEAVGGPTSPGGVALLATFKPAAPAAPVQADPFAGLPAHVKIAVDGAGGFESDAGYGVYVALGGTLPRVSAQAAPAPEPEPEPVDPFAGLPAHVKIAVDGAGGFESDAGYGVYTALGGTAARVGVAAPAASSGKRKRRTKAEIEADEAKTAASAQQAAPAQVAQPAAPGQSYAAAPAGDLGGSIDALLAAAMATPTAA
ncbi:MAG: hypothetical protein ACYCZR_00240 [Burkholderiales bacterium]